MLLIKITEAWEGEGFSLLSMLRAQLLSSLELIVARICPLYPFSLDTHCFLNLFKLRKGKFWSVFYRGGEGEKKQGSDTSVCFPFPHIQQICGRTD